MCGPAPFPRPKAKAGASRHHLHNTAHTCFFLQAILVRCARRVWLEGLDEHDCFVAWRQFARVRRVLLLCRVRDDVHAFIMVVHTTPRRQMEVMLISVSPLRGFLQNMVMVD